MRRQSDRKSDGEAEAIGDDPAVTQGEDVEGSHGSGMGEGSSDIGDVVIEVR